VDPSVGRAEKVLEGKRQSFVESAYRDTKVFKTVEDYHAYIKSNKAKDPE
jgi:tRNA splicing endonuclease